MKYNVLLITDAGEVLADSYKDLLRYPMLTILFAKTEREALEHLKSVDVKIILMDPLMSSNILSDDRINVPHPEKGGVGTLLLSNLREVAHEFKGEFPSVIFRTSLPIQDIWTAGFKDESFIYFSSTKTTWADVVSQICKLIYESLPH
jgi:hypothetical protein